MILTKHKPAIDDKWFELLDKGFVNVITFFEGDDEYRLDQKKKFLQSDIRNPLLDYPNLNLPKLTHTRQYLYALKERFLKHETNKLIRKCYLPKIEELIANTELLIASKNQNWKLFMQCNQKVFNMPSREVYEDIVSQGVLPDITEKLKNSARKLVTEELGELCKVDGKKEQYDAEQIKSSVEETLAFLEIKDWEVVVAAATNIGVDHGTHQVIIPSDRKLSKEELTGLKGHEIGRHLVRELNGKNSGLNLLGVGLDHYEETEEGIATVTEELLSGQLDSPKWLARHLAIDLALGYDGQPKDFRGVYEKIEKYFREEKNKGRISLAKPEDEAWLVCVRVFRGTDCKTPGICFVKDKMYWEGYIKIWELIAQHPEVIDNFKIGKYDPTNPKHLEIVQELGY